MIIELAIYDGVNGILRVMKWLGAIRGQVIDRQTTMAKGYISS